MNPKIEKHASAIILQYIRPLVDVISRVNIVDRSFIQNIGFRVVRFFKNIFERFYENSINMVHDVLFNIPRNIWDKLPKKSEKRKRSIDKASYAMYDDVVPNQDLTPHVIESYPRNLTEISQSLMYLSYKMLVAPTISLFKNSYITAHIFELFNIPSSNEQAKKNIENFKHWMKLQLIKVRINCFHLYFGNFIELVYFFRDNIRL